MTTILAIDPGPQQSALVRYVPSTGLVDALGIFQNEDALKLLPGLRSHTSVITRGPATWLGIEMIASYGMPVGAEVFETCVWIGQFKREWRQPVELIYRSDVKLHLCHSARAKDANVRQALIDRFGPGKECAIGKKATPGPLYGIKSHLWAALGVAVTLGDALEAGSPRGLDCSERGR